MTSTPTTPPAASGNRPQPARTFETEIAGQVGVIRANLEAILDRNPTAPTALQAALARVIGKCMPLTDADHLQRLRAAYEPPTVAIEVQFTEAPQAARSSQPTQTEVTR